MKYIIDNIFSNGVSMGNAYIHSTIKSEYHKQDISKEKQLFLDVINSSLEQISKLKKDNPKDYDYLTIQEYMISDSIFKNKVLDKIEQGYSSIDSVDMIMDEYIIPLSNSTDSYLKARVADMNDIKSRIINGLANNNQIASDQKYILVADLLYPSYLIQHQKNILGIITKRGGYTSHAAIMARSLGIPFIISDIDINDNDIVIIDTLNKVLIINPIDIQINEYQRIISDFKNKTEKPVRHGKYEFLANVSSTNDIKRAMELGFDGVGLFRTEFIFMNSSKMMNIHAQESIYKDAINLSAGKKLIFRTFDISQDKKIPYLVCQNKPIHNYIVNNNIFVSQVESILKYANDNVMLMFPMIYSYDEYRLLCGWVKNIAERCNYKLPKIGMMLETKQALDNIEEFKDVPFFSVGTNDLLKELYNIKRDELYNIDDYIDDFIIKMEKLVKHCKKYKIELTVCGEIASIKKYAIRLYKIGIKNLSVSPSMLGVLNSSYTEYKKEK